MCMDVNAWRRINLIPEHHKPLPEELRDDVKKHIQTRYQVFIPVEILRKEIAPDGSDRGEQRAMR